MQVADKEGVEEEAEYLFVTVITTGHLGITPNGQIGAALIIP